MEPSFKDHKLTCAERLWLSEVYATDGFEIRSAKVRLRERLPKGFKPKHIDGRFLINGNRLTLLGIWHVDQAAMIFGQVDAVICAIKKLIIDNPGIQTITAERVARETGIDADAVGIALEAVSDLGSFWSSASGTSGSRGYSKIELIGDDSYDAYLNYENLPSLMETYYASRVKAKEVPMDLEDVHGYFHDATKQSAAFVLMAMDPDNADLEDVYVSIKDLESPDLSCVGLCHEPCSFRSG